MTAVNSYGNLNKSFARHTQRVKNFLASARTENQQSYINAGFGLVVPNEDSSLLFQNTGIGYTNKGSSSNIDGDWMLAIEESQKAQNKDLVELANSFGGQLNPDFEREFNSLSGQGFSAGSTDTEKSYNPLTNITETKDGISVYSLSSFFKVNDIEDQSLKAYAEGLYKSDQWGGYSRAFDDLFTNALKNKGMDPSKDKEAMSKAISGYIAETARLINGAIDDSGKAIDANNRALAVSYIASHTALDSTLAGELGFSQDVINKYATKDKGFLLSEALLENPDILKDQNKLSSLKSFLTENITASYDTNLAHFAGSYEGEGNNLSQVETNMISLLTGKYAEDVKKLNGGNAPNESEIRKFMSDNGFKSSAEYHKIDNGEIAAQTYLNLKAIQHDYDLLQKGELTDQNRMYKASQTMIRSTPYNGADHNGAFNENNQGRKQAAIAGMDRDMVGNLALPFISDQAFRNVLSQMKALDIQISSADISHHGCQTGTHGGGGGVDVGDRDTLLKDLAERMADGGEILYNSCLVAAGTEQNANNLALTTLRTEIADKGLKVHAADQSTPGYHEDFVYDAFTGNISSTPRKLAGRVGGYTLVEGGIDKAQDRKDAGSQLLAIIDDKKQSSESKL